MTQILNKKAVALVTALALLLSATAFYAAVPAVAGNGAPSGAHYNLNIIGVPKDKSADMDGGNGHVIFVAEEGKSKINLVEGDFAVLDANGTDGDGAMFQLPAPGVDPYVVGETDGVDTETDYSVYVRPLGKPGGWANITTCAEVLDSSFGGLVTGQDIKVLNRAGAFGGVCSIEQVGQEITMRTKGKQSFTNVTAELTTIVFQLEVDIEDDSIVDDIIEVRVPLFDDSIANEYWEYDNHGLKLLQVRFYEGVPTDVSLGDGDWNAV